MFIITYFIISLITQTDINDLSKWWSAVAVFINIATISILFFICKQNRITYQELIGYKKGETKAKSVILMVLLTLVIGMGGMYLAGFLCYGKFPYMAVMMIQPIPVALAVINLILLPITTTLAEDGLYLGAGVNQIKHKWISIFLPAFFYALQHSFIPVIFDGRYIVYRLLSFLPLTILMCYLYRKTRNPVPFMFGHFVINIATVAQILMTSLSPELFEQLKNM